MVIHYEDPNRFLSSLTFWFKATSTWSPQSFGPGELRATRAYQVSSSNILSPVSRSCPYTPKSGTDGFHDRFSHFHDDRGLAADGKRVTMSLLSGTDLHATFSGRLAGVLKASWETASDPWVRKDVAMKNVHLESDFRNELMSNDLVRGSKGNAMFEATALNAAETGMEAEDLAKKLRNRVVGQDEAIQDIVRAYQTYIAGLSPVGRPIGNFLFLGPTGTGKTRLVEAMAECLLGDSRAVVKIDCAEFQHSHEIAKLIGSPPGYLGHRETHPALSQEALNRYHTQTVKVSLVLFDEIEKASDSLWNLLLGILDKATLTLGDNGRVDFTRAIIFMTSNLGAAEMNALLRPKLGFAGARG